MLLSNYLLISDSLYFSSWNEQFSFNQIEDFINYTKKWEWLGYVLLPVMTLIKLTLVASCVSLGLFFVTNKFAFKSAFGVALVAEFIFLLPTLLKLLWFTFIQTDYTLQDLQLFYPLSALNFFDYTQLETWWVYPLQTLNVFELAYWLVLAKGIKELTEDKFIEKNILDFEQAFVLVLSSYGLGLVLWIATVMFISVSYSA